MGSATENVATDPNNNSKFYLNDATHGRRQQLRDLTLANNNLQEWYGKIELLDRSPTPPRTNQTTASNDGNSPENLTVNSALRCQHSADAKNQLLNSQTTLTKRCRSDLTKRHFTAYVIKYATSWSPKTIGWFLSSEILAKAAKLTSASTTPTHNNRKHDVTMTADRYLPKLQKDLKPPRIPKHRLILTINLKLKSGLTPRPSLLLHYRNCKELQSHLVKKPDWATIEMKAVLQKPVVIEG
ncbi:hypothetical protein F511_35968 [Dorcoceras hygrometricum]|uniref:Uncharacterized protein n=1 Tax=Dorcoceras hygrometricum TaxID=472368 RepID=A0A2Z7CK16_9LAMI|nr:hypothetical protein F511_35968 [Dorcoceras hygrometricum]